MPQFPEDDTSSLEKARERLYGNEIDLRPRAPLAESGERTLPHEWKDDSFHQAVALQKGKRHVRLAGIFLVVSIAFFIVALLVAASFFFLGGNVVSVDKVTVDVQGATTVAGGDTASLSLTITNSNPAPIENATIEIDFPSGTRDATNMLLSYPHYIENLGTITSGETVTRTVQAVLFGGAGQNLVLPISLSYGTSGSNAVFVKKSSYAVTISSTPLDVTVDTLTESVSGQPLTLTFTVRSNATVPLNNVVLVGTFPFGFSPTSSSLPLNNSSFLLGTLKPGTSKVVTLTGTLVGQDKEQRVFHFTLGTANTPNDQTLAVTYMTQDTTVTIAAPFINTTLSINGDTSGNAIITPGTFQNVTVSYANTLATNVGDATVAITLSGSGIDYGSIQTTSGFYDSSTHTIIFSKDTDPSLASLAPGASGIGTFSFSTLSSNALTFSPTVTFTISVSGTRIGETNVPEQVTDSSIVSAKVVTIVQLSASSLHSSGPFGNRGPIPPRANQPTTYTIVWNAQNEGSPVAGGTVSATLPSYVSYTNITTGDGSFSYDAGSNTVSWNTGDLSQGASATGAFQVSLVPSTSQKGDAPSLTSTASFSGYDRFAGVQVSATANPVTTETVGDPGYVPANADVQ